jgi:anti-sigma-K factor RskA
VIRAKSIFSSIVLSLVAALIVFAATGAQAGTPQPLGITLHSRNAVTKRLPHYRSDAPIAVSVGGTTAAELQALNVTAVGPDGNAVTQALTRTGDTFSGAVRLAAPGAWSLAVSTQLGSVSAALANVSLDVVARDDADLAARLGFALAAMAIVAGLTLVLRRRGRPLIYALGITKRS